MARLPLHPTRPERICWGCAQFCSAHDLACGNGSARTPHPEELFGSDWTEWDQNDEIELGGADPSDKANAEAQTLLRKTEDDGISFATQAATNAR